MHNFSERDVSGEGGGDAAALHQEGSDDQEPARQDPRLSPDEEPLPQHAQRYGFWEILQLSARNGRITATADLIACPAKISPSAR